jgi:hypothetical protein
MLDARAILRLALHDPWAGLDDNQRAGKDCAHRVIASAAARLTILPLIQCANCDADDDKSVV